VSTQPFAARMLRALRRPNYRRYFASQAISQTGTWVQLVAEGWLVLRLGGSGLALGITTALQFTPLLFAGAYGGVIVDRLDKRRLLTATQAAAGALALATGLLTATGVIRIWMVFVAAFLLGCVNVFDNPGRQSFTRELAGPEDLSNAVALNNAVATAARFVGPAIGGGLIAAVGLAPCFLLNAASYLAVIAALRAMDVGGLAVEERVGRARGQVREGLRHAWETPSLRAVLVVLTLASTFGLNFQLLLPLLTSDEFHRGGGTYGLLMSALGLGAVLGSLLVAAAPVPTPRSVSLISIGLGVSLALVTAAPTLSTAFAAVFVMGIAAGVFIPSTAAALQVSTTGAFRGRVMALYSVAFLGVAPIGGPAVGSVAQVFGPRAGFFTGAVASVAAGALGLRLVRRP
jgi:MFS family permease